MEKTCRFHSKRTTAHQKQFRATHRSKVEIIELLSRVVIDTNKLNFGVMVTVAMTAALEIRVTKRIWVPVGDIPRLHLFFTPITLIITMMKTSSYTRNDCSTSNTEIQATPAKNSIRTTVIVITWPLVTTVTRFLRLVVATWCTTGIQTSNHIRSCRPIRFFPHSMGACKLPATSIHPSSAAVISPLGSAVIFPLQP